MPTNPRPALAVLGAGLDLCESLIIAYLVSRIAPPPSMRLEVKPHSGILLLFRSTRGPSALAIGHLAHASLLALSWHSFSPAALPSPGRGGARRGRKNARLGTRFRARLGAGIPSCRLASSRPERYARTTVYPCDAGHGAITPYLVRTRRTGRPIKSLPIERTVRLTRHPAAERRLSPTGCARFLRGGFVTILRSSGSRRTTHTAAAACFA
jgi:hypothetical protein